MKYVMLILLLIVSGCTKMTPANISQFSSDGKETIHKIADSSVAKEIVWGNSIQSYHAAVKGSGGKTVIEPITVQETMIIEIPGQAPIKITSTKTATKTTVFNAYHVVPPPDGPSDYAGWDFGKHVVSAAMKGTLGVVGLQEFGDIVTTGYKRVGSNQTFNGSHTNYDLSGNYTSRGESSIQVDRQDLFGSQIDSDNILDGSEEIFGIE